MSITQQTVALSQIEFQRRSYMALSLTNYGNDSEPAIAAGGRVEIGDTLFYVGVEQAITGWAGIGASTAAYIRVVPQGDGPPETALAEFTDVAPTWSDTKHGFYDATVAKRYIGGLYKDAGGDYTKKWLYQGRKLIQHSGAYFTALGGLNLGGASRVRVTKNDAQAISHIGIIIVQYDDVDFDNLGEFSSYKFTANEAGYYIVSASLSSALTDWGVGETWSIRLYKNGALNSYGLTQLAPLWDTDHIMHSSLNDIIYLAATDYIDIRCFHNHTNAVNTSTSASYNYFAVHRLS